MISLDLHDFQVILSNFSLHVQWRIQDFPEEGAPTYDFAKISQKLHEIERIWTGGGARPSRPPLDPPLMCNVVKESDMAWHGAGDILFLCIEIWLDISFLKIIRNYCVYLIFVH